MSVVLMTFHHVSEQVAIKFMVRGKKTITKNVLREILNHQRLLHPHIVQVSLELRADMLCQIAQECSGLCSDAAADIVAMMQFKEVFLTNTHLAIGECPIFCACVDLSNA